jgi:hypothetical protein
MWGHGYVITSLLNIAVSKESNEVVPRTSFAATHRVWLEGALGRSYTFSVATGPAPKF